MDNPFSNRLSRSDIETRQLRKLNELLGLVANRRFYRDRIEPQALPLNSMSQLKSLPFLKKEEILPEVCSDRDLASKWSPALMFDLPQQNYTRLHQTSGTSGWPMPVLDTPEDWIWWIDCWQYVLDAASVTEKDVAMMAFSFGPFIGFWTANDAMVQRGVLVVPGGGMSSQSRLELIQRYQCTTLCCTPTYALHLATVAQKTGIDLRSTDVSKIIVAGEPGGSIQSVRQRIESAWDAKVTDHAGASEIGAWGFGSGDGKGLHVIETEFIAEILDFSERPDGVDARDGELGELVITNLGRAGGPVIRYRTGDIVRPRWSHDRDSPFVFLDGGVIGRADDMMVVRGVNVFPSSIESIIRESVGLAEYRITVDQVNEMDQLSIELEAEKRLAEEVSHLLKNRLALRVDVIPVKVNTLPRFDAKAKRLVDRRNYSDPT